MSLPIFTSAVAHFEEDCIKGLNKSSNQKEIVDKAKDLLLTCGIAMSSKPDATNGKSLDNFGKCIAETSLLNAQVSKRLFDLVFNTCGCSKLFYALGKAMHVINREQKKEVSFAIKTLEEIQLQYFSFHSRSFHC